MLFNTSTVNAALVFNLGGNDVSYDSPGVEGANLPSSILTMTFEQNGNDIVRLTMDTSLMPNTASKITDVWLNIGGSLSFDNLSFEYVSGVKAQKISKGKNVSSLGSFDIDFSYNPAGKTGDFYYQMTSVYDLKGSGLTESSFKDWSTKEYLVVMHLNITGNGNSGHYAAVTPTPVPAAVWLLGSGLIGLVGARRKLKK